MSSFKEDMAHIQQLVGNAFTATGGLVALADGAQMQPTRLRKALEQTIGSFELATVELRQLCERYMPPVGSVGKKPAIPRRDVTGSVELIEFHWRIRRRYGSAIRSAACWTNTRAVGIAFRTTGTRSW